MIKVDTADWKEFVIGNLFSITKGERLVEIERIDGGTPLITASANNNGIVTHIDFDIFNISKKTFNNKITVDMFANIFFHAYEYFSDDNIHTLIPKEKIDLNIFSGLFLVAILKKLRLRYGFGRQVRLHRLEKEIIKLPADNQGNPDWQFMENYIKSILHKIDFSDSIKHVDSVKKTNKKTDAINWQEFRLPDIFKIRGSKSSFTKDVVTEGKYLYVTTSNKNNGVSGTSDIYTEKGNVITVDSATDGKSFYQEINFIGSDHVEILEPKNFVLNRHISLFIISLLNRQSYRYGFGRKRSQVRLKKEVLNLPAKQNKNGEYEPDWQFMEDYIKSLPYSSNL